MPNPATLDELLQEEIKDLYDAEKQLTKALPKLIKKASSSELKTALGEHLRQTEQQVERLEQVFDQLGLPVRGKKCEGMKHLIAESDDMIGEVEDDATRDAVMIAAAQKVEHYEIAGYGTVRTWANLLGKTEVAAMLEDTLEEEKAADLKLTQIAESIVNEEATHGAGEGSDEEETGPRVARLRRQSRATARVAAADRSRSRGRGKR